MKSSSPSLFPFVFWVSLLISVLFRQYIWISSTQSLQKLQVIRVSDEIISPDQVDLSKNIIILHGVKVKPKENYRYKSETIYDFIGRKVTATGNLETKSPGLNFRDISLEDAKIDIFGTRASWLKTFQVRFFSLAVSFRLRFANSLGSLYLGREADIMAGILLGNRDGFPTEFNRRLQQSGLMHLAAASGYNISIVVGIFAAAVTRLSRNPIIKVIIVIAFILFYIVISGSQASVVRAGLMGAVGFAVSLAGSAASSRRLFAAAALAMLLLKPAWLWDLGYQLSVAATAGMIWLVPFLVGKMNKFLAEPLVASLVTAPVLILNLGWERLSLTTIPANILATPLVAPLMAASAVVGLLGLVVSPLANFAAILTRPLVQALLLIIDISAAANEKLMAIFTG